MTTTVQSSQCIIRTIPIMSSAGLLTTVEQLPSKYKIRYLARTTTMIERPLDLTVKLQNQETTANNNTTTTTEITTLISTNTNCNTNNNNNNNNSDGPITPPPSPPKKRYRDNEHFTNISNNNNDNNTFNNKIAKISNDSEPSQLIENSLKITNELITPSKQRINSIVAPPSKLLKSHSSTINLLSTTTVATTSSAKDKKSKAIRKLKFDEETSSPVSGTIIRSIDEILENQNEHQSGDIDPQYNIVEITEEAKLELASIKNIIGAYLCKLCRLEFDDAFGLAQHRCSCIVLLEYRCPECDKRFNCPANLASHRRWHKPKDDVLKKQQQQNNHQDNELQYKCPECNKQFKRQAYLRKHLLTHKERSNNNDNNVVDNKKIRSKKNKIKDNKKIKLDNNNSNCSSRNEYIIINNNNNGSNSINSIGEDYSSSQSSSSSAAVSIYREQSSAANSIITNHSGYDNRQFYKYDSDIESRSSDCSSPGRLQIIENNLTEEENIAATALAHLRNGQSVIQHTHATMAF